MEDIYCALCGVVFGICAELYQHQGQIVEDDDIRWSERYLALWEDKNQDRLDGVEFRISGAGTIEDCHMPCMTIPGMNGAEFGYEKDDDDYAVPYTTKNEQWYCNELHFRPKKVIYPIHDACWGIFLQQYALASPNTSPNLDKLGRIFAAQRLEDQSFEGLRGLIPGWAGDYGGAEEFWDDGWYDCNRHYDEPVHMSNVATAIDDAPQLIFVAHDPENAPAFDGTLEDILRSQSANEQEPYITPLNDVHDAFSPLPVEILHQILCLLPTNSYHAVRSASQSFAAIHPSNDYWRSKFAFPHELCHISLPSHIVAAPALNWRSLYYHLMNPANEQDDRLRQCRQNRDRIAYLNSKLVSLLLADDSETWYAKEMMTFEREWNRLVQLGQIHFRSGFITISKVEAE